MPRPDFVNNIGTFGCVNGVANISFVTHIHSPSPRDDGTVGVATSTEVTADLRMDLFCVQQLKETCEKILADNTKQVVS